MFYIRNAKINMVAQGGNMVQAEALAGDILVPLPHSKGAAVVGEVGMAEEQVQDKAGGQVTAAAGVPGGQDGCICPRLRTFPCAL